MIVHSRLQLRNVLRQMLPGDELRVEMMTMADLWPNPPYPQEDDHLSVEERARQWLNVLDAEAFTIHDQPGFGIRIRGETAWLRGGPFDGQTRPGPRGGGTLLRLEKPSVSQPVIMRGDREEMPDRQVMQVCTYIREGTSSVFRYQE